MIDAGRDVGQEPKVLADVNRTNRGNVKAVTEHEVADTNVVRSSTIAKTFAIATLLLDSQLEPFDKRIAEFP